MTKSNTGKVTIKKYANRRLYDTESSSYVTLDRLAQMIRDGRDFEVIDAKSGDDITHQVLTQIIVEEEARGGATLLPVNFLRQIIGLYGNSMQGMVPQYLESAMAGFQKNQAAFRDAFGANIFSEISRRNMEMLEQFTSRSPGARHEAPERAEPTGSSGSGEVDALRAELDALKAKVDKLGR
ncbi:MAG TPA: polyhydroxyalkanoate synthesis repressor PhaR [Sphingomicrobium sp.]|jgi:polyhydroxyalkanoate synthesis repressor PhaR|nr:polyhydroxyalkanoate synthesis repressor PhaR [Sphingomicrobium sp.]